MSVGAVLPIFCFLHCRTAAMSSSDILLFLGFCFHLIISSLWFTSSLLEGNAVFKDI